MIKKIREILDSCPKDREKCSIQQLIYMLTAIEKVVEETEEKFAIPEELLKEADKFLAHIDEIRDSDLSEIEKYTLVDSYINSWQIKHTPSTKDIVDMIEKSEVVAKHSTLEFVRGDSLDNG